VILAAAKMKGKMLELDGIVIGRFAKLLRHPPASKYHFTFPFKI